MSSSSAQASPAPATTGGRPVFPCAGCPASEPFRTQVLYLYHVANAHHPVANIRFNNESAVVKVRRNAETGLLECPRCNTSHSLAIALGDHAKVCSGEPQQLPSAMDEDHDDDDGVACQYCPLFFTTKGHKKHHYRSTHQPKLTVSFSSTDGASIVVHRNFETGFFSCPRCPATFAPSVSLYAHVSYCEGEPQPGEAIAPPPPPPPPPRPEPEVTCRDCPDQTFATKALLREHRKSIHTITVLLIFTDGAKITVRRSDETGDFTCARCPEAAVNADELRLHASQCTAPTWQEQQQARREQQEQENPQEFTCKLCPELVFRSKAARIRHSLVTHQQTVILTYRSDDATVVVSRDAEGKLQCPRCLVYRKTPMTIHTHANICTAPARLPAAAAAAESSASAADVSSQAPIMGQTFTCSLCPGTAFKTRPSLTSHQQEYHQSSIKLRFGDKGAATFEVVERDAQSGMFRCPRCGKSYKKPATIYGHAIGCAELAPLHDNDYDEPDAAAAGPSSLRKRKASKRVAATTPRHWGSSDSESESESGSESDGGSSAEAAPIAPQSFSCRHCPGLVLTHSERVLHMIKKHQIQVKIKFRTDGGTAIVLRDPATGTFACPRCQLDVPDPGTLHWHARKKCEAPAPLLPAAAADVDYAALERLDLAYEEEYGALVCGPCKVAVGIGRLADHWAKPQHVGSTHSVADAHRALGTFPAHRAATLATPDPFGPAIESLECITGHRCAACGWCGNFPQRHWDARHGVRSGLGSSAPSMPIEMARKIKMQRWSHAAPCFEVERGQPVVEASPEPESAPAVQAAPRQVRGSSSASSRSNTGAALVIDKASVPSVGSGSSLAAAFASAPSLLARAFTFSRASESAQAQPAEASTSGAASASTGVRAPIANPRALAAPSSSIAEPVSAGRPRPRATASQKAAPIRARSTAASAAAARFSPLSDAGFETASSKEASDEEFDWEKRDASMSNGNDWDERGFTPDWPLDDEELDGNHAGIEPAGNDEAAVAVQGDEAADLDAAAVVAPRAQLKAASDFDESDWEGPMVVIDVPRKAQKTARSRSAHKAKLDDTVQRAIPSSHSASQASRAARSTGSPSSTPPSACFAANAAAGPSSRQKSLSADGSPQHSTSRRSMSDSFQPRAQQQLDSCSGEPLQSRDDAEQTSIQQLDVVFPQPDQAVPDQVAMFFTSLLGLATHVLAPAQQKQQLLQLPVGPPFQRALETAVQTAAILGRTQERMADSAEEQLDSASSDSTSTHPGSTLDRFTSMLSSSVGDLRSSQPTSSELILHDSSKSAWPDSHVSPMPYPFGLDKDKQRMRLATPESDSPQVDSNKRRRLN